MGCGHLKALSVVYERMKWHSAAVEFVGAVGSTVGGVVIMGIDYDNDTAKAITLPAVAALNPNVQTAAYKNARMAIPLARMQPQKWVSTESAHIGEGFAGRVIFFASASGQKGKTLGYIRLHYDVSLAGPRSI